MAESASRRRFLSTVGLAASGAALARAFPPLARADGEARSVLVLGAGLAGLRAAWLLEQKGFAVTVLEARGRLGGRLLELPDVPGRPEAGGQVLGTTYARMRSMAEAVGARLGPAVMGHGPKSGNCADCHKTGQVPGRRGGPGSLLVVGGRPIPEAAWAREAVGLSESEREVAPDRLLASLLAKDNPLGDGEAWTRPEHAKLDGVSLLDYAKGKGASAEAIRLMDVAPNCPSLGSASALWGLRDAQRRRSGMGGVPLQFASGSTAFVAALARAVRGPVLTGKVVASISTGASGTGETASAPSVSVRCVDGSSYRADFAVSTLPIPALGDVAFDPPLTAPQADALKEVASTPITVVYLAVRRDFWESDGWPVSMWTDSPVERVFPIRDAEGKAASIVTFVDGPAAARLDAMGEPERLRFVERELARIRPSTKGAVEGVRSVSWAKDRFAGGAYPFYAPGQVARHRARLQAPAGLLHFAGEHTAVTQPGMEGACESADRAVAEIVSRATGLPRPASPSAPPKPA